VRLRQKVSTVSANEEEWAMAPRGNGNHRGRNRRRILTAPLVVVAAGGLAACGTAAGTIVLGAPTTTQGQCPPLMGITNCTTTTVEATSTSYYGVTPSTLILGVSTTTYLGVPAITDPPVTDTTLAPEATLPKTK
jgi:hypothetical protein